MQHLRFHPRPAVLPSASHQTSRQFYIHWFEKMTQENFRIKFIKLFSIEWSEMGGKHPFDSKRFETQIKGRPISEGTEVTI